MQRRPFHEVVIDVIKNAPDIHLGCLAGILLATKIPVGHDYIIAAWKDRLVKWHTDFGVPADLLKQKEEVENETREKVAASWYGS